MIRKIVHMAFFVGLLVFIFSDSVLAKEIHGLVCYEGNNIFDKGFNQMTHEGVKKATVSTKERTFVIENFKNVKDKNLVIKDMRQIFKSNWDFVVGVGKNYDQVFRRLAQENVNTKFIVVNGTKETTPSNMKTIVFDETQTGYLAGVAAAAASNTGNVGFVGNKKKDIDDEFYYGFREGANSVNPVIRIQKSYVDEDENEKDLENKVARMYKRKADVAFYAGLDNAQGIFSAARKNKKFAIGLGHDQGALASEEDKPFILTSVVLKVDSAVSEAITSAINNNFIPGVVIKDYKSDSIMYTTNNWNKDIMKKVLPALIDAEAKLYLEDEELEIKRPKNNK